MTLSQPSKKPRKAKKHQVNLVENKGTLRQACPRDKPRAQVAFKHLMIHGILQFTSRIAFRCVLHRCKSQDIRCWEYVLCSGFPVHPRGARGAKEQNQKQKHKTKRAATTLALHRVQANVAGGEPPQPGQAMGSVEQESSDPSATARAVCKGNNHTSQCGPSNWTKQVHNVVGLMRVNDPSAGSPTETLLRLLLPLNDKV
jgi:hypothetical protein